MSVTPTVMRLTRCSMRRNLTGDDDISDGCDVDAVVVLGVPAPLDVEQPDRLRPERERTPVPRAAVQDEDVAGVEQEGTDRLEVRGFRERLVGGCHREDARNVEAH